MQKRNYSNDRVHVIGNANQAPSGLEIFGQFGGFEECSLESTRPFFPGFCLGEKLHGNGFVVHVL